ncbi:MAG: hypothetical protein EBS90_12305 [Betaproteobacteria bacterium]|nr:hypothetical protein [Betaproteobacteria bacterium]
MRIKIEGRWELPGAVREIVRNKMVLDSLTMGDLCCLATIHEGDLFRGEFAVEGQWFPISSAMPLADGMGFFTTPNWCDFVVPKKNKIKVSGSIVETTTSYDREVKIRLYSDLTALIMKTHNQTAI